METKYTAHKQDVNPNLYTQEIASAWSVMVMITILFRASVLFAFVWNAM
jgi:hypothetical protein